MPENRMEPLNDSTEVRCPHCGHDFELPVEVDTTIEIIEEMVLEVIDLE